MDFDAIIKAGQILGEPKVATVDADYAVIPEGSVLEDLERFHEQPRLTRAKVTAHTTDTFISYFKGYASDFSAIFADESAVSLVGIIDYHATDCAAWAAHRVSYTAPRSTEWNTWMGMNKKPMAQAAFAQFIEDNVVDIREPPGADMLEVSRSISATKSVEFASSTRLSDGSQQFSYSETIDGSTRKGTMKVPEEFKLGIPVFVGGVHYEVRARLRYRIDQGKLALWYDLYRPEHILKDAFNQVVETVKNGTATEVWMGNPGAS